jgi:colicin import membrane protein
MAKLHVDQETGEIIQQSVAVRTDKAPTITLDINAVKTHHNDPEKLVDMIRAQAGYAVFDVSHEKGRAECRAHAANIIRCISPAVNASKALAEDAKKVVKQDLEFRKVFEQGVREIAAFHRQPLTEWEAEQERIKEEKRLAEESRLADEQYLKDWQEAIDYDELFTLRREKEEAARREFEAKIAEEEKALFEREVEARLERERQRIQAEEEAKAQRMAYDKLRAEQEEKAYNARIVNEKDKLQADIINRPQELFMGTAEAMAPIVADKIFNELNVESPIERKIKALEIRIEAGDMSIHDALMVAYRIGCEQC